jgi:hypothetical protein
MEFKCCFRGMTRESRGHGLNTGGWGAAARGRRMGHARVMQTGCARPHPGSHPCGERKGQGEGAADARDRGGTDIRTRG